MKIVVVSDNHGDYEVLNKILRDNPSADYYFHLGDSEMDEDELRPFASVRGNVDDDYNLHSERIIDVGGHFVYMCHGHGFSGDEELIAKNAKACDCDIALFGHTHCFLDKTIKGVRTINPGSSSRGKDGHNSYVLLEIDKDIKVNRIILD